MTQKSLGGGHDVFMGIDVDKKTYSFTVKDHNTMSKSKTIPADPEHLYNYTKNQFPGQKVLFAYEAGPTGYGLYDYLSEMEEDCQVIAPASIPKPPNQKVKNNRIDSRKIANELRSGNLKPIRVPQEEYRELRHLVYLREIYVFNRVVAKQRIKSLLLHTGLWAILDAGKDWSANYIQALKELPCSKAVRQRLDMLLKDHDYARKQTSAILRQLREFVRSHKEIKQHMQYLVSIPGIGFITAVSILGRIGNPKRLKNVREIGGFFGLVPREYSTGENVNRGSITHLGNRIARSLLVEAAWAAIRIDTELGQFYYRVKRRHHPKVAAKKAIVAVARKLTARIYCVLKEQREYIVH